MSPLDTSLYELPCLVIRCQLGLDQARYWRAGYLSCEVVNSEIFQHPSFHSLCRLPYISHVLSAFILYRHIFVMFKCFLYVSSPQPPGHGLVPVRESFGTGPHKKNKISCITYLLYLTFYLSENRCFILKNYQILFSLSQSMAHYLENTTVFRTTALHDLHLQKSITARACTVFLAYFLWREKKVNFYLM